MISKDLSKIACQVADPTKTIRQAYNDHDCFGCPKISSCAVQSLRSKDSKVAHESVNRHSRMGMKI